jgi:hypothetical protein
MRQRGDVATLGDDRHDAIAGSHRAQRKVDDVRDASRIDEFAPHADLLAGCATFDGLLHRALTFSRSRASVRLGHHGNIQKLVPTAATPAPSSARVASFNSSTASFRIEQRDRLHRVIEHGAESLLAFEPRAFGGFAPRECRADAR